MITIGKLLVTYTFCVKLRGKNITLDLSNYVTKDVRYSEPLATIWNAIQWR